MPNIRKSFHFREGVQVDDEVLVVRGSRVGIGTTVPDEALDVRGDAKVTGIVTTNHIYSSGISTLTELRIGTGVTISASSGIISATEFRGSAANLTNLPTSVWTSYGSTGVYNQTNVGAGTAFPTSAFQVGADPYTQSTLTGVGIGSDGNIKLSGIITASSFSGPVVGNITGNITGEVNAQKLDTSADGLIASGISTFNNDVKFVGFTTTIDFLKQVNQPVLKFWDTAKAIFGNDNDLHIYHAANASYIHASTSDLIISNNTFVGGNYQIRLQARNGKNSVVCHPDQYVTLYFNGSEKLTTTNEGTIISGIVTSSNGFDSVSGITTVGFSTVGVTTTVGSLVSGKNFSVAGISTFKDRSEFDGNVDFFGSTQSAIKWDKGVGQLKALSNVEFDFGFGSGYTGTGGLRIYSGGPTAATITSKSGADLRVSSNQLQLRTEEGSTPVEDYLIGNQGVGVTIFYAGNAKLETKANGVQVTGITTSTTRVDVAVGGTAFSALASGDVGIGTAIPGATLQIKKPTSAAIDLVSDIGVAKISIGNSVGAGNSSVEIRYGSNFDTLDIINNSTTGSVDQYIQNGVAGINTGKFNWFHGQGNLELMTLTHDQKLGIGLQNPSTNLHVVGTSTVTGNAWVGGNLSIDGTLSAGVWTWPTVGVQTFVNAAAVGSISTFHKLDAQVGNISSLGINTPNPHVALDCKSAGGLFGTIGINTNSQPIVNGNPLAIDCRGLTEFDHIGIGTTSFMSTSGGRASTVGLHVWDKVVGLGSCQTRLTDTVVSADDKVSIRIGGSVHAPRCAIDFSDAGTNTDPIGWKFMLPPKVTNAQVTAIGSNAIAGAIIYNTDTNKLRCYDGSAWQDLF